MQLTARASFDLFARASISSRELPSVRLTFNLLGSTFNLLGSTFELFGPTFELLGGPFELFGPTFNLLGPTFQLLGGPFELLGPTFKLLGGPFELLGSTIKYFARLFDLLAGALRPRCPLSRRAEARPTSALPRPREGDQRLRRPQSRMASGSGVPAAQVSSRRAMGIQYQVADSPPRERRARRPAEPRTNGLTNGEESSTVMMSV
jgi:hypothetical protein